MIMLLCACAPSAPPPADAPEAPWPPAPAAEGPLNVLVVVWDTVRADRLALYGHPAPTTPKLSAFAEGALVFDQAMAPGHWTLPSHASLFTGLPVRAHGATYATPWLDDAFVTQAEWFGAHGYDTWAWSSNPNVHPIRNLTQGIAAYHSPFGEPDDPWRIEVLEATRARLDPRDRSTITSPRRRRPKRVDVPAVAGPVVARAFPAWLRGRPDPDRPFWAFVNLMEAHDPRLPTAEARARMLGDRVKDSLELDASPAEMRKVARGERAYSEADRQVLLDVYDATLRDLDRSTGALLDALRDAGALDRTVVVLTSDHGELFGEHGAWRHNATVHQELLHVPLVMRIPGGPTGRLAHPVSTTALFATLCRLAGLPLPEPESFDRTDLLGPPPARVFADATVPVVEAEDAGHARTPGQRAVWEGRWKAVWGSDGHHALYDLEADPGEVADRSGVHPEEVSRLLGAIEAWHEGVKPHVPDVPNGVGVIERDGTWRRDAASQQLEALGYLEP